MLSLSVFVLLLTDLVTGQPVPFIIGGRDTTTEAHPHQVSLQDPSGKHMCGASIVARQWIVTAAHCVFDMRARDLTVSLNDGRLRGGEREIYKVRKIILHPRFLEEGGFGEEDIALLKLKTRMDFEEGHKIISLPTKNQNFTGMTCTITGWGMTDGTDRDSKPNTLQEAFGKIILPSECEKVWGESIGKTETICIYNSTTSACIGDSGGPMVCGGVLAGITSFGDAECDPSYPSVYTRVSTFAQWLKDTMARN